SRELAACRAANRAFAGLEGAFKLPATFYDRFDREFSKVLLEPRPSRLVPPRPLLALAACVALCLGVWWLFGPRSSPLVLQGGGVTGNGHQGSTVVSLHAGDVLQTAAGGTAVVAIADVGSLRMGADTQLRIEKSAGSAVRLHLNQG